MDSLMDTSSRMSAYTSGGPNMEGYSQMLARWATSVEESHDKTLKAIAEAKQEADERHAQDKENVAFVRALIKDHDEYKAQCSAMKQQLDAAAKAADADQEEHMRMRQRIASQDEEMQVLRAQSAEVSSAAHMQVFKLVSARGQLQAAHRQQLSKMEDMLQQVQADNEALTAEVQRLQVCLEDTKAEHADMLERVIFTKKHVNWSWEDCCRIGEQQQQLGQDEQARQAAEQQMAKMQEIHEMQLAAERSAAEQQMAAVRSAAEQQVAEAHRAAEQRVTEARNAASQQVEKQQGDCAHRQLQAVEGAAKPQLHTSSAGNLKMAGKGGQQGRKLLLQQAQKAAFAPRRPAGSSSSDGEDSSWEHGSSTSSASSSQQGWGGWGSSSSDGSQWTPSETRWSSSCGHSLWVDWAHVRVPCDGWGSVHNSWANVRIVCDGW